jgi:hypothetical protein
MPTFPYTRGQRGRGPTRRSPCGKYLTPSEWVCTEKLEPVSHSSTACDLQKTHRFVAAVKVRKVSCESRARRAAADIGRNAQRQFPVFSGLLTLDHRIQESHILRLLAHRQFRVSSIFPASSRDFGVALSRCRGLMVLCGASTGTVLTFGVRLRAWRFARSVSRSFFVRSL